MLRKLFAMLFVLAAAAVFSVTTVAASSSSIGGADDGDVTAMSEGTRDGTTTLCMGISGDCSSISW